MKSEKFPEKDNVQEVGEAKRWRIVLPKEFVDPRTNECHLWLNAEGVKDDSEIVALVFGKTAYAKFFMERQNIQSPQDILAYAKKCEQLDPLYPLKIDPSHRRITVPAALRSFIQGRIKAVFLPEMDTVSLFRA